MTMKKALLFFVLFLSTFSTFAQTSEATNGGGKMISGLSIALIVVLGLVLHVSIQKNKLHKENQRLYKELQKLKNQ